MAYTAQVEELGFRYTWLPFCYTTTEEYRCWQAAARFRWGVNSQHVSTVPLKKSTTPGQTLPKQRIAAGRRLGPGGKEVR